MARIGIIFGGRSVEHEVSLVSARTVFQAVVDAGHQAVPLGIAPDGVWVDRATAEAAIRGELARLPSPGGSVLPSLARLAEAGVEAVFPITHGTWGEDGTLQGLFEMIDLPYVGPNVTTSAIAMDKLQTKRLLGAVGVPVVDFEAVTRRELDADPAAFLARCDRLPLPLFVKPSVGGSSVGVQKVSVRGELEAAVRFALRFDDAVLVERGVAGRELEVAVLGYERIEASVVGEIVPGRDFYDYEDKYLADDAQLIAPAELPAAVAERLRSVAVAAFSALGGSGLARVDFLLEGETPYLNELNTLPGFTRISMYPRLWGLSGVPLPELVGRLIDIAFARHRDRHRLDRGIHEWIAELAARGEDRETSSQEPAMSQPTSPKTVAILGASANRAKYGNKCVRAYLHAGWTVYPVNPGGGEIEGLAVYRSLADVPKPLDRISVYLAPPVSLAMLPEMAAALAGDVFFNPGSADEVVLRKAKELGIPAMDYCSIVEIGLTPAMFPG